jgi:RNA polymerase sigma-70 factor (ECF subfamily)
MIGFSKKAEASDEELVKQIADGNASAFTHLYHRYNKRLLYYFYRMLGNSEVKAQDFLQDLFMKVIDKADSFDPSRKFSTWIFSIAHNMCKNEYRRLNIQKETPIDVYVDYLPEKEELNFDEEDIDPAQFQKELFEALDQFDEIHKSVFLLHYREGFSLKDIAVSLDISEGTIKSRLHYTRKRLAAQLLKHNPNIA